jgi:hypothetical protein
MYNYQAAVAQQNREINLQNADYARHKGEAEAQQRGLAEKAREGSIIAGLGASNLDVNSGSAKDVIQSQEELGSFNQSMIRSNAAKTAYGFEVSAAGNEAEGSALRASASNAETASEFRAASSILGGASSVASKWYQFGPAFGST